MTSTVLYFVVQIIRCTCLSGLVKICNRLYIWFLTKFAIIPAPLRLRRVRVEKSVRFCGGYADIRWGQLRGKGVAVKIPRRYTSSSGVDEQTVFKDFLNEVMIMEILRPHPRILALLGISSYDGVPCIVTPWMEHGTINEFLRLNAGMICRKKLVRTLITLRQIVDAMVYMKKSNIVHGDLKGTNILVDQDGNACIADFGLSVLGDRHSSSSITGITPTDEISSSSVPHSTHSGAGSPRWMAPELHLPEKWGNESARPTFQSDIFALGMVIYEIYSGKVPFYECNNCVAIYHIIQGKRPPRPARILDDLWHIAEQCWDADPCLRPSVESIHAQLDDD
ncbi:kinase-like domain-containing protein [Flammula alnicola]|nr:kinase-like domain-containing protein [Flammula alnicola]